MVKSLPLIPYLRRILYKKNSCSILPSYDYLIGILPVKSPQLTERGFLFIYILGFSLCRLTKFSKLGKSKPYHSTSLPMALLKAMPSVKIKLIHSTC